jgi:hypothetical protein
MDGIGVERLIRFALILADQEKRLAALLLIAGRIGLIKKGSTAVMTEKSEAESADTAAAGESWFSCSALPTELHLFGFRLAPGGTHLARTLMLAELGRVLEAARDPSQDDLNALVLDHNILHKQTGSARWLSLRHLRGLYGLGAAVPITRTMVALWAKAKDGQPMLALLAALAREPLLREISDGDRFEMNVAVIVPHDPAHFPAIWAFCSSPDYAAAVRRIDHALKVTNATLVTFQRKNSWHKSLI